MRSLGCEEEEEARMEAAPACFSPKFESTVSLFQSHTAALGSSVAMRVDKYC